MEFIKFIDQNEVCSLLLLVVALTLAPPNLKMKMRPVTSYTIHHWCVIFYMHAPINTQLLCNPAPRSSAAPYVPVHTQAGQVIFLASRQSTLVRRAEQTG